ncbi:MAG: transcriptional regulator GcvA [Collimonas sp.]|uniref:transcriptional regulator GcvA n=1 Tax=Collimonas sp. TaxID=1963772 RepID=UPI0032665DDC
MKLPPLPALRAFEALARLGKIVDAAEELHVTHSAVSHQVKALEDYIGAPLVTREGRSLTLTEEGRIYAYQVRQALGEIAGATEKIQHKPRDRQLTISVLPSYGMYWLLPRLQNFIETYPDLRVSLSATMTLADFEHDLLDCAIRFGHGQWPDVHSEPLMDDTLLVVAAPTFNGGDLPLKPEDVMQLPLLHASESWPVWLSAAGCEHIRPRAALEFTDSSMMLEAARLGYRIALTRRSIAHAMIESRQLVRLTEIEPAHPSRYFLVWPVRTHQSPKLLLLLAWLKEQVADYEGSLERSRKNLSRKKR